MNRYRTSPFLTNFGTSRRNRNIRCTFICHWWTSSPADYHLAKQLPYHYPTQGELESAECQLQSPEYVVHSELKQAYADLRDPFWEPKQRWYVCIICFDVFFFFFVCVCFLLIFFSRSFFRLVQHVFEVIVRWCDTFPQFFGVFFEWSMTLGCGARRKYTSSATKMWVLSNTLEGYTLWLWTW